MAFLPLLDSGLRVDDVVVNPHAVDRLADTRRRELAALAETGERARRAGRTARAEAVAAGETVRGWRRSLGRRLVGAGLRLGLPPRRRQGASSYADSLLAGDDRAGGGSLPTR